MTIEQPADDTPATHEDQVEHLIELWSIHLPVRLDPWLPRAANALADGAWTAAWPRVAAYGPVVAFGIGFLAPLLLPLFTPDAGFNAVRAFSELLPLLAILVAAAFLSGTLGAALALGIAAGHLPGLLVLVVSVGMFGFENPLFVAVTVIGVVVMIALLVGLLTVGVPQVARMTAERTVERFARSAGRAAVLRTLLYAGVGAVMVYLWAQGMVVLLRPIFIWMGSTPTTPAIESVQLGWPWLVGTAVVAAVARMVLEQWVVARSERGRLPTELLTRRWELAQSSGRLAQRPEILHVAWTAVVVAFLLAGTYEAVFDPILVLLVVAGLGAWRRGMLGEVPDSWARRVERIPSVARLVAAPIIGYLLATVILELFWSWGSMRPVLLGALLTLAAFYALFPLPSRRIQGPVTAPAAAS